MYRTPKRLLILVPLAALAARAPSQVGDFDTRTGYETRVYAGSSFPYACAVADFDLDLDPDVAIVSHFANPAVSVMLNDGDGSYGAPTHYPQSHSSLAIEAADVDGDGLPDLLSADYGANGTGNTLAFLRNSGGGAFAPAVHVPALAGPVGLVARDFDLDGDVDVVVCGYGHIGQGNQIALLRGDGGGGLAAPQSFPAGASPYRLAAGDLNDDGWIDLVVGRDGGKLSVLMNLGGVFAAPVQHTIAITPLAFDQFASVNLADNDHDGDLDVFYTSNRTVMGTDPSFGAMAILANDGSGVLSAPTRVPLVPWLGGGSHSVVSDADGDGWLDLFTVHLDAGGFTFQRGNGSGGFAPGVELPGGQAAVAIALADVDGDQALDALVLNRDSLALHVHRNEGGSFSKHAGRETVDANNDIDAGDVDFDGDADVVASGAYGGFGTVELLRNHGDGSYAAPLVVHAGAGAMAVKLRDLNGDGALDLLWCDHPTAAPYDFWTALNDGAGNFGAPLEWPTNTCGNGDVDTFDMDGDGDLDVFVAEALGCAGIFGARVFVARNRGDGSFDAPYTLASILRPQRIASGDLDGDGDADLLYGTSNGVEVALGHGDGSFDAPVEVLFAGGARALVVADLSGDGLPDLATATSNSPAGVVVQVRRGLGDGSFGSVATTAAGYSPDLANADELRVADIDADGDLDLLALNWGDGDVSMLRNRGDGSFATQVRYGLGPVGNSFACVDLDGDGVLDLAGLVGIPPSDLPNELVSVFGLPYCAAPVPYCTPKVNSLGLEAQLFSIGTPSYFAEDFALRVEGGVPNQPGVVFYGTAGPASLPFNLGTLCVQGPLVRLPVVVHDAMGSMTLPLSVDAAGTTRWYQHWYRDPQHPDGTGVALTGGLAVGFCH